MVIAMQCIYFLQLVSDIFICTSQSQCFHTYVIDRTELWDHNYFGFRLLCPDAAQLHRRCYLFTLDGPMLELSELIKIKV